MARTKNRETNTAVSQFSYNPTRWNLAKYIRLSKEDLNRGKDDSNSVTNQKKLLDDYYRQHLDEFESAETYVDDGCTGTDTNRADFQRLLADIYAKKVNCVIVKDLSRLSRNYTDAGSLIENLFVQMNVRFISLAEGVDSYLNPDSVSSILVPITNVMNDQYCYQTSKKIRQVFDYKKRNGEFIGSYAPYGYIKDPKDGHITHNDYRHMSEDYEQQNEAIGTVIANLKKERDELENGIDTENPFLATFRKYENIDKLTREILIELVDHIKVYEGGDISIRFKFADELRRIIQYIEVNSHLQVG